MNVDIEGLLSVDVTGLCKFACTRVCENGFTVAVYKVNVLGLKETEPDKTRQPKDKTRQDETKQMSISDRYQA